MAEAPPARGSQEWIEFKTERIAALTKDERWPVEPSPGPDSTSANNLRHEEWLDEQEWPSASNEWLSRRGHPLTPAGGERPRHEWLEVRQLRDVRLHGAVPRKSEAEPISPSPLPSTPSDIDVGKLRAPHVIQSFHGGGFEAVEQQYQRALSLAGGSEQLVDEYLAMRRRRERSWQVAPGKPHRAAQRQEQELYDAYEEAARKWQERELLTEAAAIRETLALRQRNAPPNVGYRPGSAAQRRAAGNRPPPWNGAPPWGRTQRW